MVQDGVDVCDDTIIGRGVDGLFELFLGTPLGTPGTLLFKLSKIPEVVTTISHRSIGVELTHRNQFLLCLISIILVDLGR